MGIPFYKNTMCGITAIYAYHDKAAEVNPEELRTIRDAMIARGPDAQGEWFSVDNRVGLGHRRLSIIDLSERASQPMSTPDGLFVIIFNGEIYNYRTLRSQLEAKGVVFQSHSDTEVLLHLYAQKGEAMLPELRGMFAFVLWDARKQALLLARDPYGIKPLYYADDGRTVHIASQVKALLAGGQVSRQVSTTGIVGFFLFGSVPEPNTFYEEIRAVPAGHLIRVDRKGTHTPECYFSLAQTFCQALEHPQPLSSEELQEFVRLALLDSVRHHLVADVPVGAFLSAGVDSGTLVGLMRDAGQNDIQTVTLAFEEFRGQHQDEAPLAEQVANYYGTRHTTRVVTEKEFQADIPKILEAMDQPSINGINTWFVSKTTKELGLKVAISGLGGDELFGGYPSFREIPRWVNALAIPAKIPLLGDLFRLLSSLLLTANISQSPKITGLLKYGGTYSGAYFLSRGLFMPWELNSILDKETTRKGLQKFAPILHIQQAIKPEPSQSFAKIATLEASLYMRNQLLRDTDWAGMSHSLEVRTPLVDVRLLQSLSPVLVAHRQLNGKSMLSMSPSKPLPDEIVGRSKTGFSVPTATWLNSAMGQMDVWQKTDLLRRDNCHWARRWAYIVMLLSTAK